MNLGTTQVSGLTKPLCSIRHFGDNFYCFYNSFGHFLYGYQCFMISQVSYNNVEVRINPLSLSNIFKS